MRRTPVREPGRWASAPDSDPAPRLRPLLGLPSTPLVCLSAAFFAASSHQPVKAFNPYWDKQGQTFVDPDGYRVVLQHASWSA